MADQPNLDNMEVFCKNEKCGDPVSDGRGRVHFTKRRMNLTSRGGLASQVVFTCPVCGQQRKFRVNGLNGQISEVGGGFKLFDW